MKLRDGKGKVKEWPKEAGLKLLKRQKLPHYQGDRNYYKLVSDSPISDSPKRRRNKETTSEAEEPAVPRQGD